MSEQLEITITNWKKYQGRSRADSSMPWIRLDTKIRNHPLWDAGASYKIGFITLLLMAAESSPTDGVFVTTSDRVRSNFGSGSCRVRSLFDVCSKLGLLTYRIVKYPSRHLRTNERTDVVVSEPDDDSFSLKTEEVGGGEKPENQPAFPTNNAEHFFQDLFRRYTAGPLKPRLFLMMSPVERQRASILLEKYPDVAYWDKLMQRAEKSRYLTGRAGRPFQMSLQWLLREWNHSKLFEGNWDDFESGEKAKGDPERVALFSAFAKALQEDR